MSTPHATTRPLALALLLLAVAALLPACRDEDAPASPEAAAHEEPLRLAYDLSISDPVNALLARWAEEHPKQTVSSRSDASTALSVQADAGSADADVLIMSEQIPLPTGDHAPIAVRPWTRDPIILVAAAEETRDPEAIFESDDRIAIAIEASPLGQFTRFGFRKLERWDQIKPRLLRFSDETGVMNAVASGDAAMGVVYASALAETDAQLERLEELVVSDAAERSFVVLTITPEGAQLARWLAAPEQTAALADFGLDPASTRPADD